MQLTLPALIASARSLIGDSTPDNPEYTRALVELISEFMPGDSEVKREQLEAMLTEQEIGVEPGIYQHFMGRAHYEVLGGHRDPSTGETMVLYRQSFHGRELATRPLAMLTEHITRAGYSGPRFVRISALPQENA